MSCFPDCCRVSSIITTEQNQYHQDHQGYCLLLDADNVEKNESFLSWLSVGVNVLNKSKMERIEKPFSYYLDSLE